MTRPSRCPSVSLWNSAYRSVAPARSWSSTKPVSPPKPTPASGPAVLPDFLPPTVRRTGGGPDGFDFGDLTGYVEGQLKGGTTRLYADYQALADRHVLGLVLRHTDGNLSQASRLLGITRATLRAKLSALGLAAERPGGGEGAG